MIVFRSCVMAARLTGARNGAIAACHSAWVGITLRGTSCGTGSPRTVHPTSSVSDRKRRNRAAQNKARTSRATRQQRTHAAVRGAQPQTGALSLHVEHAQLGDAM